MLQHQQGLKLNLHPNAFMEPLLSLAPHPTKHLHIWLPTTKSSSKEPTVLDKPSEEHTPSSTLCVARARWSPSQLCSGKGMYGKQACMRRRPVSFLRYHVCDLDQQQADTFQLITKPTLKDRDARGQQQSFAVFLLPSVLCLLCITGSCLSRPEFALTVATTPAQMAPKPSRFKHKLGLICLGHRSRSHRQHFLVSAVLCSVSSAASHSSLCQQKCFILRVHAATRPSGKQSCCGICCAAAAIRQHPAAAPVRG